MDLELGDSRSSEQAQLSSVSRLVVLHLVLPKPAETLKQIELLAGVCQLRISLSCADAQGNSGWQMPRPLCGKQV